MLKCQIINSEAYTHLRSMPSDSVDAVITDPPYSSGGAFRSDRNRSTTDKYVSTGTVVQRPDFQGDSRDQFSYMQWMVLWLVECMRVAVPGATLCVFTDWRQLSTTIAAVQAGGWVWRGVAVWDKTEGCRPQRGGFRSQAEYIVHATRGPRVERDGDPYLPGVFSCTSIVADKPHITGKPTPVMRWLVKVCPEGGTILDPFCGGGTTGLAAVLEGRNFIGIEIEKVYAEMAINRIREHAGLLCEVSEGMPVS